MGAPYITYPSLMKRFCRSFCPMRSGPKTCSKLYKLFVTGSPDLRNCLLRTVVDVVAYRLACL